MLLPFGKPGTRSLYPAFRDAGALALSKGGGGYAALRVAISQWNTDEATTRVIYGGRTTFTRSANVTGGTSGGRTYVGSYVTEGILQDGYIRSIDAEVNSAGATLGWKFKLFRPDGAGNYDVVAETENFTAEAVIGTQTFVPAVPLGPCQPGDRVGLWINGSDIGSLARVYVSAEASSGMLYKNGDLSTIRAATATTLASFSLNLRFNGTPPFLVCVGDSIIEGHNGATQWHSFYHTGPDGNPAAEPFNQLRALVPTLEYQNYGKGSQTWAFAPTAAADLASKAPWGVIAHFGVNDVSGGRSWAAIEADMDAFLAALPVGTNVFINEVLPWNGGDDTQAAAVRALNANYASWCTANGATLIPCHDPMGQIRGSTGELDDLITAYADGTVHLSVPAGVNALALEIARGIEASL